MKKQQIIAFGFLILVNTICNGQTNQYLIGIEGGPSLISLRGNEVIEEYTKPTIGYSGAFFFQYKLNKILSFRTNLAFERKGAIYPQSTTLIADSLGNPINTIMTVNLNYDYLTLPLLMRATFGEKIQFFINAGLYFGYLIKSETIRKENNLPSLITETTSQNKRFDTGITAGMGISIPIKDKILFSIEIRNNLGIYNISSVPIVNNQTLNTNSTNFIVGIAYKL